MLLAVKEPMDYSNYSVNYFFIILFDLRGWFPTTFPVFSLSSGKMFNVKSMCGDKLGKG